MQSFTCASFSISVFVELCKSPVKVHKIVKLAMNEVYGQFI